MATHLLTKPRTILGIGLLAAIMAAGAYAFAASNTVDNTNAGSGSGTVSGFSATNVSYTLDATDPTKVDTITFDLSPTSAATVKVKAGSTGSWTTCTNTAGSVECDYTSSPIDLQPIDELDVVAVD